MIIGLFSSASIWLYNYIISIENTSSIIGFLYLYPFLTALLVFIFLNEKIACISYLGMTIAIMGSVLLSTRLKKTNGIKIYLLLILIIFTALSEFLLKLTSFKINPLNAIIIINLVLGITTILIGLLYTKNKSKIFEEVINISYSIISFTGLIIAEIFLVYAIYNLPITIVSAIAVSQPLFVLFYEYILEKFGEKINYQKSTIPCKLCIIIFIILGLILIYSGV